MEKNKFIETLKAAVAKDPRLAQLDRNHIIEKLKCEGILQEIMQQLPTTKKNGGTIGGAGSTPSESQTLKHHNAEAKRLESKVSSSLAAKIHGSSAPAFKLEPNRRYLSCRIVGLRALVDFISPREDEFIYATVSFLRQRF